MTGHATFAIARWRACCFFASRAKFTYSTEGDHGYRVSFGYGAHSMGHAMNDEGADSRGQRAMKLYQKVASLVGAYHRCCENGLEARHQHLKDLRHIEREHLPSGSGIDNGTHTDIEASDGERIVLDAPYHHMDENGYYDGWNRHTITVTASPTSDIIVEVEPEEERDDGTTEYLVGVFYDAMVQEVEG